MTQTLDTDVFTEAYNRIYDLYASGDRVVVSFSAGKDSGVVLELAILAAKEAGRLPVDVCMRDEEIMFPGTFEYAERCAERPEVNFHWQIAGQPVVNVFNRREPYFWVFDDRLDPSDWVRTPPPYAYRIPEQHIQGTITLERFPVDPGKRLVVAMGLRASESVTRRLGIHSKKGYITTQPNRFGVWSCTPIYDWKDEDVWKSIKDFGWDYNTAYDVMFRLGVPRSKMRIAPPTLTTAAVDILDVAIRAWPKWFDKVSERLPGLRTAAMFGRRAVEPERRQGEDYKATFEREVLGDKAPQWIRDRAGTIVQAVIARHRAHSDSDLPQVQACPRCPQLGSYKMLAKHLYMGDPFSMKQGIVPAIEPEFFREGAGTWGGGSPSW